MTIDQFDKYGFKASDKANYDGRVYPIVSVDFKEKLVGINENIPGCEPEEVSWKRCENIDLA